MRNVFVLDVSRLSVSVFRLRQEPFRIDQVRSMIDPRIRGKTVSLHYPLVKIFEPTLETVLRSYQRLIDLELKFKHIPSRLQPLTFAERVLKSQLEFNFETKVLSMIRVS